MPFELVQVSPRKWKMTNTESGAVHFHRSKAKADAHMRLLNSIHSLTGKGLIQDKYIESLENPSDKFPPKVPLPLIGNFEIAVPPYIIKPIQRKKGTGKQGYKLVKTLTKTRNLSTREGGFPSIQLVPETHEVEATVNTYRDNKSKPTIDQFSKKDQAIIKKLFLNPNDELHLKNKQRGFPEFMRKNIERHRELGTSQLSNDFVIPPPKKRGRPKKTSVAELQAQAEAEARSMGLGDEIDFGDETPAPTPRTPRTPKAKTPRTPTNISFETSVPSNYETGDVGGGGRPQYSLMLPSETPRTPQAPTPQASTPQPVKKGRGRPKKYDDDVERKSIQHQQQRDSSKRLYLESLTPIHREKYLKKQEAKALKGKGILSSLKKIGRNVKKAFVDVGQKTETLFNKVIHSDKAYPPNLTAIKNELGNEIITSLQIGRTPVPKAITSAMNAVSLGGFNKIFKTLPYDKLFHLFLIITTDKGKFMLEKNERINVSKSIPTNGLETRNVVIPNDLSVNTLIDTTQSFMGGNFLPYDPANQNCQDFILSLLKANKILTSELADFVKQDTSEIFKQNPNLAKISRGLTDVGAAINVIQQGGRLGKLKSNHINMDTTFFHQLPQAESQIRSSLGIPQAMMMMQGRGIGSKIRRAFRSIPRPKGLENVRIPSNLEDVVRIAVQQNMPTVLRDATSFGTNMRIPTDEESAKRYGKIGLTYGLPAFGSAAGSVAGLLATAGNPMGGIAGATLGGVTGRIAAEQINKSIDGSGMKRRGRPRKMSGGMTNAEMLAYKYKDRGVSTTTRGRGILKGVLDKPFTARQAIRGAKSLPSVFEGMKQDIAGASITPRPKRFAKGSAEAKAYMAKIRGMKRK